MSVELAFHPEAREELDEAVLWYEGHRSGLGLKLLDRVRDVVARIEATPHSGTPAGRFQVWRVQRFPYAVVYVLAPSPLVVAFAHTKRRPGYWVARSP